MSFSLAEHLRSGQAITSCSLIELVSCAFSHCFFVWISEVTVSYAHQMLVKVHLSFAAITHSLFPFFTFPFVFEIGLGTCSLLCT